MADDASTLSQSGLSQSGKGAAPGTGQRESLGDFLSKHPVMTVTVAVCVGAVAANALASLIGSAHSRSMLERAALHHLRMARRLGPYSDPLASRDLE